MMAVIVKQFQNLKKQLNSAPGCTVIYTKISGRQQNNLFMKHSDEKGIIPDSNIELMEDLFNAFIHSWEGFDLQLENGKKEKLACEFYNCMALPEKIRNEILALLKPLDFSKNGKPVNAVKNSKAGRKS